MERKEIRPDVQIQILVSKISGSISLLIKSINNILFEVHSKWIEIQKNANENQIMKNDLKCANQTTRITLTITQSAITRALIFRGITQGWQTFYYEYMH